VLTTNVAWRDLNRSLAGNAGASSAEARRRKAPLTPRVFFRRTRGRRQRYFGFAKAAKNALRGAAPSKRYEKGRTIA